MWSISRQSPAFGRSIDRAGAVRTHLPANDVILNRIDWMKLRLTKTRKASIWSATQRTNHDPGGRALRIVLALITCRTASGYFVCGTAFNSNPAAIFLFPLVAAADCRRPQKRGALTGQWALLRREYALIYRAGLLNKTDPFELMLRDKLNNFVRLLSKTPMAQNSGCGGHALLCGS